MVPCHKLTFDGHNKWLCTFFIDSYRTQPQISVSWNILTVMLFNSEVFATFDCCFFPSVVIFPKDLRKEYLSWNRWCFHFLWKWPPKPILLIKSRVRLSPYFCFFLQENCSGHFAPQYPWFGNKGMCFANHFVLCQAFCILLHSFLWNMVWTKYTNNAWFLTAYLLCWRESIWKFGLELVSRSSFVRWLASLQSNWEVQPPVWEVWLGLFQ